MKLNLPILDQLAGSHNILVAGAGGGFDVYAGLPIYFTLRQIGKTVHLANLSFCDFSLVNAVSDTEILIEDVLMGVYGSVKFDLQYLPEPYLAQWFQQERHEEITIWMLPNEGAVPITTGYKRLVEHLSIDAIILVDGGVDSLMRGDEQGAGTLLEDTLSLIAVDAVDVPLKIQACIGFGTEVEEQVCHYNALENMAALIKDNAFLGSCALTPQMEVFQLFEAACRYVWEQPDHHKSHISTRIIPAVHGEFGDFHMYPDDRAMRVFISPLMFLYWFFDVTAVVRHSRLIDLLRDTQTKQEARHRTVSYLNQMALRRRRSISY